MGRFAEDIPDVEDLRTNLYICNVVKNTFLTFYRY